jgi:hypothetical protein
MVVVINKSGAAGSAQPEKTFPSVLAGTTTKGLKEKPLIVRGRGAGRYVKILMYSNTGAGKTLAIAGFLRAGLKVVCCSTDLGGSGLSTVYNYLDSIGQPHLADNLIDITFQTYDQFAAFLNNPESILPEIYEWDPDMLAIDGFTGFQQIQIQEKILELNPLSDKKASEGRMEGLWADQEAWGMIRNATTRALGRFLMLHNWKTGKPWHKYVTCLENKPQSDKLTGEVLRGPYIQGSAAALMGPSFDVIIEAKVVSKDGSDKGKREYVYNCVGHDKLLAKSRGYSLSPTEPADMYKIWTEKIAPLVKGGVMEGLTPPEGEEEASDRLGEKGE